MRSVPPTVDADLVAFLHDLPEGATEAIGKLMSEAALAGAKRSSKQAWVRLALQSVVVGGLVIGGLLKLGDVATKTDIKNLEIQYTGALDARSQSSETVNNRIAALERLCDAANTCCAHQADRLDNLTKPVRLGAY